MLSNPANNFHYRQGLHEWQNSMPRETTGPVNVKATGRVAPYDVWPWDWDFRNNCRYVDHESQEQGYDESDLEEPEHRGRSLRRKTSNDSLLSICLSEAGEQHQQEAASRSSSLSVCSERYEFPFRPESPYSPPSPFQGKTSYGDPVLVTLGQVQMRRHSNSKSHNELSSSLTHEACLPKQPYITDSYESAAASLDSAHLLASLDTANSASDVRNRKHRLPPSECVEDLITSATTKRARNTVPNSRDATRQNQDSSNGEINSIDELYSSDYSQPEPLFLLHGEPPRSSQSSSIEPSPKVADQHPKSQETRERSIDYAENQQCLGGKSQNDSNGQSNNFANAFAEIYGNASELSNKFVTCHICQKFTGRSCDLKKHMRRHERPYGCTFQGCLKAFGSKNDWKRHEMSQHLNSGNWRCDVQVSHDGIEMPCGKQYYSRFQIYRHLRRSHQLEWVEMLSRAEQCRVKNGMEIFSTGFWCGFCRKSIDPDIVLQETITERFDHIDHHFIKEGRKIEMWMPQDYDESLITLDLFQA